MALLEPSVYVTNKICNCPILDYYKMSNERLNFILVRKVIFFPFISILKENEIECIDIIY